MNLKMKIAALGLAGVLALSGCTALTTTASTTSSDTSSSATASGPTTGDTAPSSRGGSTDASNVTTEAQLIQLIQEAYGDGSLGLHRGHQPIEDVLDEVLAISHDELHVRMESGQNLSDVAEDLGVGTQTLIDALVAAWSPAIDSLVASGEITQEEADAYLAALEEAFTFRVTWDGEEEAPVFEGLEA